MPGFAEFGITKCQAHGAGGLGAEGLGEHGVLTGKAVAAPGVQVQDGARAAGQVQRHGEE